MSDPASHEHAPAPATGPGFTLGCALAFPLFTGHVVLQPVCLDAATSATLIGMAFAAGWALAGGGPAPGAAKGGPPAWALAHLCTIGCHILWPLSWVSALPALWTGAIAGSLLSAAGESAARLRFHRCLGAVAGFAGAYVFVALFGLGGLALGSPLALVLLRLVAGPAID